MAVALPRSKVMCVQVLVHVYTWTALPGRAVMDGGGLINRESSFSLTWAAKLSVHEAISRFW